MASQTQGRLLYISLMVLTVAVLTAAAVLFSALLRYDSETRRDGTLFPIAIEGEYSEEGGPWTPLTPQTNFENLDLRDITLRGHFNRALPLGAKLFMNIDHMRVSLRINGEEVFRLAPVKGDGNPTRAMGKQWVTFVSPGITTDDVAELNFGNLYWNAYMIQFDELLRHMHTGDERMMLMEAVREDGWTLAIGTVFLFLTLFLLVASLCCGVLRIYGALRLLWLGLTTFFSALWFYTLSPAPTLILPWPIFLNVLYAFSMQGIALCVTLFVASNVFGWRKRVLYYCEGALLLLVLTGLINQMLRLQDLYSAINYFSVFDLIVALCIVFCLSFEAFRLKKQASGDLLKALFPLVLCAVVELVNGYMQFCEAAIFLGIGLILFTVSEGIYTLRRIKQSMENEKRMLTLENELAQNRIAIMLSQIQPHFLYNALNTIMNLCYTDAQTAGRTVASFTKYLRGNLDALASNQLISFDRELEHLKNYLSIEKLRFPDLKIVYDLGVKAFLLPPLTLQPLVENAIHYGITKRESGGTVTLTSHETEACWKITIQDDGVGFSPTQQLEDGRCHIGISNTRERLAVMCSGTLAVESIPGIGTTVTIIIPKEADTDARGLCG